jgi:hypothetical protein
VLTRAAIALAGVLLVGGCSAFVSPPAPAAESTPVDTGAASPPATPSVTPAAVSNPRMEVRITAADALAVARAFTREPLSGATAELMEPGLRNRSYWVDAKPWSIFVDAFDGRPVLVSRLDVTTGPGPHLAPGAATAKAMTFLVEHGIPIPVAQPVAELVDHGTNQVYEVTWQARTGQALAPDLRRVRIDAVSGQFVSLLDDRVPYAPPPPPVVTANEAVNAARVAAGMPDGVVEEAPQLRIWFDDAGGQILVWEVVLGSPPDAYGGAAMVHVDAVTGETTVMGRG